MTTWPAYSRKQWIKAVNSSALFGYFAVVGIPSIISMNPGGIIGAAPLGIPFAFLCCWLFAAPILKRLMQWEISWRAAASWGAGIATIMALISIALGRYMGWRQSLNPNVHSRIGGEGYVRSIDGILTPYGWQILALNTLTFIATGALIAIAVKWIVGEPAPKSK